MGVYRKIRRHVGPGYLRFGPVNVGCLGIGCLVPTLLTATVTAVVIRRV